VIFLELSFLAPKDKTAEQPEYMPTEMRHRRSRSDQAVADIRAKGENASKKQVRAVVKMGHERADVALERAFLRGALKKTDGPRGAHLFDIPPRPTTSPQDQSQEADS
jgi:hypothetical protein